MVAPKIYVIIRIYGVGKGDATGLSVYIDPETLRQKGELDFRTETWAVTPKLAQPPRPGQFESGPIPPDTPPNSTAPSFNGDTYGLSPSDGTNIPQSSLPVAVTNYSLSLPSTSWPSNPPFATEPGASVTLYYQSITAAPLWRCYSFEVSFLRPMHKMR